MKILFQPMVIALAFVVGSALSLLCIMVIDSTIGLHSLFGVTGDIDLLLVSIVITGFLTYFITKHLKSKSTIDVSLFKEHILQSSLVYLVTFVCVLVVIQSFPMQGTVDGFVVLVALNSVVALVTNILTLGMNKLH